MNLFSVVLNDFVHSTIHSVKKLKNPVPRSCHIGNNTSNNWGFLALLENAYLVQYDHTTYGVDEVCAPWLVLGNGGLIEYCFTSKGTENKSAKNVHLNVYLSKLDKLKYSQCLNYSLPAIYDNTNLFNYFYRIANTLSLSINGKTVSFDSRELLSMMSIIVKILEKAVQNKILHLFMNRWVSTTKKGAIVMENIRHIYYEKTDLTIILNNGCKAFCGSMDMLFTLFVNALIQINALITANSNLDKPITYPWISLPFAYLIPCIKDFAINPSQKIFWHGVGSASQYYIQSSYYQNAFTILTHHLIKFGYLPSKMKVCCIPTFCCQLFATTVKSKCILEEMIIAWKQYIHLNYRMFAEAIYSLLQISHPGIVVKKLYKNLSFDIIRVLRKLLQAFNENDANTLPIAHMAKPVDPMYHRYGISQICLKNQHLYFPDNFFKCRWGELELLTKILAEIANNSSLSESHSF